VSLRRLFSSLSLDHMAQFMQQFLPHLAAFQLPLSGSQVDESQHGLLEDGRKNELSTPSLGITARAGRGCCSRSSRVLSTPSLGITHDSSPPSRFTLIVLSTPSLGITFSFGNEGSRHLQLSTPSLGITSTTVSMYPGLIFSKTFNSLSRDHRFRPEGRSGCPDFQLPLSGSLESRRCYVLAEILAFNSLSRDHSVFLHLSCDCNRCGLCFQLPLSGSHEGKKSVYVPSAQRVAFNSLSRDHGSAPTYER